MLNGASKKLENLKFVRGEEVSKRGKRDTVLSNHRSGLAFLNGVSIQR